MNHFLPTRPNQPHLWEESSRSPLRLRGGHDIVITSDADVTVHLGEDEPRRPIGTGLRQFFLILVLAVFSVTCYYTVSRYVITAVVVQGRSMNPTLNDGERYFLNRWAFAVREPHRGEVVVIRDAGHHDYAVKRVIGLPNETVDIKDGKVLVNGVALVEPYLFPETRTVGPDTKNMSFHLGPDHYFFLGDNRSNSEDSRYYGALSRSQIVGLLVK